MSGAEAAAVGKDPTRIFAALADPTRLALLRRLSGGGSRSIAALAADTALTRQAVTKHLGVLARAGLVHRRPAGRRTLFAYRPERVAEARDWLDQVAAQWDDALSRLKAHVEG